VPQRETLAMIRFTRQFRHVIRFVCTLLMLLGDALRSVCLCLRPGPMLAAENLFLRKQLALYQERKATPGRATHATRLAMVVLSRWFDWRQALAIVRL
jgi:putative transposase